jgi:hypothetical protein
MSLPVEPLFIPLDLHAELGNPTPPLPLLQIHEEMCCICHELLTNGQQNYKLSGCNHIFHTDCIAAWWIAPRDRSNEPGNCPLCRGVPLRGIWKKFTVAGRVTQLRKLIKKDNVPKVVKKAIEKLQNAEAKCKKERKEWAEFAKRDDVKIMRKKLTKMRSDRWKWRQRIRQYKLELAAFDPMAFIDLYN